MSDVTVVIKSAHTSTSNIGVRQSTSNTNTITVSKKRIVIVETKKLVTKTISIDDEKHGCLWYLLCCFCCSGSKSKVQGGASAGMDVNEQIYQTVDLKDVSMSINDFQQSSVTTVGAGSGFCCGGGKVVTPDIHMSQNPSQVQIILKFSKKIGDFVPGWDWKGDIKTSHKTVTLNGTIDDPADAQALKRALLDHPEVMKPSEPAVQSISIASTGDENGGAGAGITSALTRGGAGAGITSALTSGGAGAGITSAFTRQMIPF